jgi:hypothetical protein
LVRVVRAALEMLVQHHLKMVLILYFLLLLQLAVVVAIPKDKMVDPVAPVVAPVPVLQPTAGLEPPIKDLLVGMGSHPVYLKTLVVAAVLVR